MKTELTHKEAELNQLNAQVDALRSDVNHERSLAVRFNDDLEAQRSKNNVSHNTSMDKPMHKHCFNACVSATNL